MNLLLIGNHFAGEDHNQNIWQDLAFQLIESNFGVFVTSRKKKKILRLLDMLYTIWNRRSHYQIAQVDVFSGSAFKWAFLSAWLAKKLHKPVILTLHGGNLPGYASRHPGRVKWLLEKADAVTAPSGYLQEAMQPYRQDITLIPNALDISRYPFIERTKIQPNLVWLRAFHRIYNPELAIRVVHALQDEFPDVHLIMVGPDKGDGSLQDCQALSTELGVADRIEFIGKVAKPDVPACLNKGDIFINTTNYDNTPISVMEAMACGLCVVSTNVGGVPYLISQPSNGLLVKPDDVQDLAGSIRALLTEPDICSAISRNARSTVERFDWSRVMPLWMDLLARF